MTKHVLRWQPARFGKTDAHCSCGAECPFHEPEAIQTWFREHAEGKALDAIADTVLAYRPTSRSEPARQRKRRKTILEKKRKVEKEK